MGQGIGVGTGTRPTHGRETKEQLCLCPDTRRNNTLSLKNNDTNNKDTVWKGSIPAAPSATIDKHSPLGEPRAFPHGAAAHQVGHVLLLSQTPPSTDPKATEDLGHRGFHTVRGPTTSRTCPALLEKKIHNQIL